MLSPAPPDDAGLVTLSPEIIVRCCSMLTVSARFTVVHFRMFSLTSLCTSSCQKELTGEDDLLKVKEIEVVFNDINFIDGLDHTPNLKSLTCTLT